MIIDLVRNIRRKVLTLVNKMDLRVRQKLWEEAIRRIVGSDNNAFFMEIGSWDGVGDDLLYPLIKKHKISGILIEPQDEAFCRLKENYAEHDKVIFENVAVAEKDGIKPLFFVSLNSQAMVPAHASLKKEVVEKEIAYFQQENVLPAGDCSRYISSRPFPCLSISSIMEKHNLNKVDILQIDAEGYEYEILRSVPFDKIRPKIIRYEYKNMDEAAYRQSIKILKQNGYAVILHIPDMLALQNIKGIQQILFLNYLTQFARQIMYGFVPRLKKKVYTTKE